MRGVRFLLLHYLKNGIILHVIEKKEVSDMAQVTKDTMIGELLRMDQKVAPILLEIGMHCLGCPSSQMETIEQAAMVHGVDPQALVDRINDALA